MQNKLVILTTTYNCSNFIERCLFSIMSQTYKNFACYITDDVSTDSTVKIISDVIKNDNRFILIQNKNKLYQPGNYDLVLRGNKSIGPNDVCVEVDGDDWLPDSKVFERINNTYKDDDVWIANGSFKYHDNRMGFAKRLENVENIRKDVFTLSHLRTWRSFLWEKIKPEDLKNENGIYYEVAGDLAFMFPMVEMSGLKHYRFMPEINYIYNESNPINDHKVNFEKVKKIVEEIRNKTKYRQL